MSSRSAVDTIRGYCYQFDKSIVSILSLTDDSATVELEGIEDIDVKIDGEILAIQCKYYEKTEYNHSVISKPIRLMLRHFVGSPSSVKKYYLYGHYKSGQDKLTLPLSVDFLKDKFLSYVDGKSQVFLHEDLHVSDSNLEIFLSRLTIDNDAENFEDQKKTIVKMLVNQFGCKEVEALHYYYNAAFDVVARLSSNHDCRVISRSDFISKIDRSRILFNIWMCRYHGKAKYLKKIREDIFVRDLNTEPYDRFFIINASSAKSVEDVKECLHVIQKKWSHLSKRSNTPYSPFIYIHGMQKIKYVELKQQIYNEGLIFRDGYNFLGSIFCVQTILEAKKCLNTKFQLVETVEDLRECLESSTSRKEIYQFFCTGHPIELSDIDELKKIEIQIDEFTDIKELV
jgi:hypothetical protein